jgi:hypothetical protein
MDGGAHVFFEKLLDQRAVDVYVVHFCSPILNGISAKRPFVTV